MEINDLPQKHIDLARWLLKIGLAFVYFYAAIEIYLNATDFLKYVPTFVHLVIPVDIFLALFAVFEIILALWLISGRYSQYASSISFLLMLCIIFPNMAFFSILFRNVAIAFASLALVALDSGRQKQAPKFFNVPN